MISDEKRVENLRNRKFRICTLASLIPLLVLTAVFQFRTIAKCLNALHQLPEKIQVTSENIEQSLPKLIAHQNELVLAVSRIHVSAMLVAGILGVLIVLLIFEIQGTRHQLTISMWEKIKKLEEAESHPTSPTVAPEE